MTPNNKIIEHNSKRTCEPCKRRRRLCDSQAPCTHCAEANKDCVYVQEHSPSAFPTQDTRRLSSACETCRRRKTKCDGGNPCVFCIVSGIECIYPERKKNHAKPTEAIDRIEDRLQRIERLMAAFSPSFLNQAESHRTRPLRHSMQGVNSAKEKKDLLDRKGSMKTRGFRSSSSISTHSQSTIDHSMLNLTLSPSNSVHIPLVSSSASTSSDTLSDYPKNDGFNVYLPTPSSSSHSESEFKLSIPSVTDQLSEHTFATSSTEYTVTQYPIYPLATPQNHPKLS